MCIFLFFSPIMLDLPIHDPILQSMIRFYDSRSHLPPTILCRIPILTALHTGVCYLADVPSQKTSYLQTLVSPHNSCKCGGHVHMSCSICGSQMWQVS